MTKPAAKKRKLTRNKSVPSKFDDFETNFSGVSTKSGSSKKGASTSPTSKKRVHESNVAKHSFFSMSPVKKTNIKSNKNPALDVAKLMRTMGIDNMARKDYIPSPLDQTHLVAIKPVDLLKKHGGRGGFAKEDILAGTCIGIYTGDIFLSKGGFETFLTMNPKCDDSYAMCLGETIVDAARKGNFTRYFNFSDTQDNLTFVERMHNHQKVVKVITNKFVKAGQQLLINYNTYEERASKVYYFLNPEDGDQSATELYKENISQYNLKKLSSGIPKLKLKKNDKILLTTVGRAVLDGKQLSQLEVEPDSCDINLPFLKANSAGQILDFDEADAFDPLMLACYKGQLENVKWLINHKANVDRQQNHSGNCPLFFALVGYEGAKDKDKPAYLNIIKELIENEANVYVHDRADRTFLHIAISVLSTADFKKTLTLLNKQDHINFNNLFTYIDENDHDVVMYCLKNKCVDKAKILLESYPEFFTVNFRNGNKKQSESNLELFQKIIEDYTQEEKEALLKVLNNKKLNVPMELLVELGFPTKEVSSDDEDTYMDGNDLSM
jgi:hypothetical protein